MEDLGGKQEKTAGWELVRLLRFGEDDDGGDKDCVLVTIMVFILIIFLSREAEKSGFTSEDVQVVKMKYKWE